MKFILMRIGVLLMVNIIMRGVNQTQKNRRQKMIDFTQEEYEWYYDKFIPTQIEENSKKD